MAAPATIRLPPTHEKGLHGALCLGALLFIQGPAEFVEGNVLNLADALAGDAEFFPDLLECLEALAIEAKA